MSNINSIPKNFSISVAQIRQIIKDFHAEMSKGLLGKKSSLKMIPAYVDTPSGNEKGRFIALDLGGTNLRLLELELKGKGKIHTCAEKKFELTNELTKGPQKVFFDFIASCVKDFLGQIPAGPRDSLGLGFTFSFPIKQTGVASGVLLNWTKDFSVKGAKNKEVVGLLRKSFAGKGLDNIKISALVNDTVGTLVARSYSDPECDVGVILGTGTNACYREKTSRIRKLKKYSPRSRHMIVNIEWGNFDKLKANPYDKELDKASLNPGEQILEKMVSGMYLGEITRLAIRDFVKRRILFEGEQPLLLNSRGSFKTQYLSMIEGDSSGALSQVEDLLKKLKVSNCGAEDRLIIKEICKAVSTRGARISAAVLAAVITRMDERLSRKHTIAIDGSLYEKHPGYAQNIKSALREIFGRKSRNIKLVLTKDGSGKGAAITAAAVVS